MLFPITLIFEWLKSSVPCCSWPWGRLPPHAIESPTWLKTMPCTEASLAANSWCVESWRQRPIFLVLCQSSGHAACKDLAWQADPGEAGSAVSPHTSMPVPERECRWEGHSVEVMMCLSKTAAGGLCNCSVGHRFTASLE